MEIVIFLVLCWILQVGGMSACIKMKKFRQRKLCNFTTSYHFFRFTHYQRILMVGGLVVTVLVLLLNRDRRSFSERIIQIGSICSIIVMSLEVIRYELTDTSYLFRRLFSTSFSVFGIMIFVFSLLFGYYSKLSEEILRKRNLEMVVYTDGMTGIPNRTAVIEFLNSLRAEDDYGVVFFDVNDLKKANDVYGHETGDRLISEVADVLRSSFLEHDGFCGRYGGDEFVAGFTRHAAAAVDESLKRFREGVSRLNEQKALSFEVRVAFGSFVNDPSAPVGVRGRREKS